MNNIEQVIQLRKQVELDMRYRRHKARCVVLVERWHCLLDYNDLEEWFGTNRCCVPISLSRMLDKRIIKAITEL